jgi:DNA replicative helicase MCM subunit Mcm2 (Cdc46/Mcm family)
VRALEFGEKAKSFRYAVIVCPKCKQHVQITETGKKTLKCQRCGALLQTQKLRVFHTCEELAEAVDFRARLQAEISGKGYETFTLGLPAKNPEFSKPLREDTAGETREATKAREFGPENRNPAKSPSKKDQKLVFLEIIGAAGGKIEINELRQRALDRGISPEKFEMMLKKLQETGELYSPEPSMIKRV